MLRMREKMEFGGGYRVAEPRQRGTAFAKTTRPAMGTVVQREALFARLDGTPGRTVAWIAGPPGAGKTTLAASYVAARGLQCIWYGVDPDDADAATFFHYLRHAARKLDAGRARELPAFTAQHAAEPASFARQFFRQLFARVKAPLAIVLDNLHDVPADSPLHAVLEAGFAQVPRGCVVIVASRTEPPPSLARLRASGEMAYVGADELRITPRELAEIADLRGQPLAPAAAERLHGRTQGWAAGLVLMLEHAKISGRIAELPDAAAPQVIFDYLAGQTLDRFDPAMQQFLLRIACLPRMTAAVAESLAGEPKAGRMLVNLAQNGWFVREVQAEEGRMFQLHPLLREFLRSRAAQVLPEAVAPASLQRAAALLREADQTEDAVSLLAESHDWAEVARVVVEERGTMLGEGRSETLGAWLELLPVQLVEGDPRLLHAAAACRAHTSPRAARRLFERAFDGYARAGDARGMVESSRGVIDAIIFEFDELTPLDRWTAALSDALARGDADPAAALTLVRAMLLRDPGDPALGEGLAGAGRPGAPADGGEAPSDGLAPLARAMAALIRGDFAAADATIGWVRARAAELTPSTRIALELAAALHQLVAGDYVAALGAARAGLAAAEADGLRACDGWLRLVAAAAALAADDRDGARAELQALVADGAQLCRGDRALVHYLRAWLAALEGDAGGAQREAKVALAVAVETGIPWLECLARLAVVQALSSSGDRRGAEAQVRAAGAIAERLGSPLLGFGVALAAAAAASDAKDEPAALESLATAFAIGREHGFRGVLGWRPQGLSELCAAALRADVEPDFARTLVRARRLVPQASARRVRGWPWPFRIVTLGGFQLARDGAPLEFAGKGPGRPVELLKVLVALGGENVRADHLADALWPHVDADYAHKSFTATLHRLRRMLEDDDALLHRDGRLSLSPALVWVDTWALEDVLEALDAALRAPGPHAADEAVRSLVEEALSLYRGPYLPDETEQPSYIACRNELRARLLRPLARIAREWEEAGKADVAIDCYLRCIEADELWEACYRQLMLCYQRSGNTMAALEAHERLRTTLAARLKAEPSPETQAIYGSLKNSK